MLIIRVLAMLFLILDIAVFIKMISLVKKHKDDTVEGLGNKLKPYLCASGVVSVLLAICMIIMIIMT